MYGSTFIVYSYGIYVVYMYYSFPNSQAINFAFTFLAFANFRDTEKFSTEYFCMS